MKNFRLKLRLIFIPFVLITVGFIAAYTLLHWLLFIKVGVRLKDELIFYWLPIGLSLIVNLFLLRPRIKLLMFNNDNASFFFQFLAFIAITLPTILAQEYLVTSTGKLTQVENVAQIAILKKTKYYTIKDYYIDTQNIAVQNTATITGRHNENFNMLIYITMPILSKNVDSFKPEHQFWLGKKYKESISNRLSNKEKDEHFKAFAEKCQKEFEETDFSKFTYLEVYENNYDYDEYKNALKNFNQNLSSNGIIFEAKTDQFESRNGNKLIWIFISLGAGFLAFFLILLFAKMSELKLYKFKKGEKVIDANIKQLLKLFIPQKRFLVTPIIIELNFLIYLIMVFSGLGVLTFKSSDLLNWGANYRPMTLDGQWWRLVSSTFLHGGLMHILSNMEGLLFVGIFLEPLLGTKKYIFVYFLTGTIASIASIWWYDAIVSVGASGSIFGLYGFFLACLLLKVFPPDFRKVLLVGMIVFVVFNLIMGLTGGIDNAAHIGGLLSGFLLGIIMSRNLKRNNFYKETM